MDKDDRMRVWMTVIGLILVIAAFIAFATIKYNCCMAVVNDHDLCVYDVACNSG